MDAQRENERGTPSAPSGGNEIRGGASQASWRGGFPGDWAWDGTDFQFCIRQRIIYFGVFSLAYEAIP